MYASVISGAVFGVQSYMVQVEVNASGGLPCFAMVGYLAGEVKEAGERVRVALRNTGVKIPPLHITVNLSPAHLRKEGTAFDLPIAVGVLMAMGILPEHAAEDMLLIGELGLDGSVKRVKGVLPIVREAVEKGYHQFLVPAGNVREAAVIPGASVCGAETLKDIMIYLAGNEEERKRLLPDMQSDKREPPAADTDDARMDFSDIAGQEQAKRAAVIAAAGCHHLMLVGPPGTGKTMIARRLVTILPALSEEESLEVSSIYSVAGLLKPDQVFLTRRPFLNPHYTVTEQALAGGGKIPGPGVVSLAHRGVLFMDELPECKRSVIEILRQPIEDKEVTVARVQGTYTYPADFLLIAAMNPCPCGYYPDREKCACSEQAVRRYVGRISGPILDRIDLCAEMTRIRVEQLRTGKDMITGEQMRRQVDTARRIQQKRYEGAGYRCNGDVRVKDIPLYCKLGSQETVLMEEMFRTMKLSARAYHRTIKVARTIADLEESECIREAHLLEAAHYRMADGNYWK